MERKQHKGYRVNPPEIRPQIDNLPSAQPDQHAHGPDRKPLDPLVRALVGVAHPLLAGPQVLHLVHNLRDQLLDAPQVGLDGLELLLGLDARPVAGVGPDVDVELDVAGGVRHGFCKEMIVRGSFAGLFAVRSVCRERCERTARNKLVLETDVECSVGGGGKRLSGFPCNVSGMAMLISEGVSDLSSFHASLVSYGKPIIIIIIIIIIDNRRLDSTYVHVDNLPISSVAAHDRGHNHQLVLGDEIPYAPLMLPGRRGQVELESIGEGEEQEERQEAEERPRAERGSSHLE